MAYLAPIHRPSSVRHAIRLNLLNPEEECLVLAKANRIEIWRLTAEGLSMLHSKSIYGRVSMLQKIRPFGAELDHLFIGTARFQYFTVAWNAKTLQLDTAQLSVDVSEKHVQSSQSRDRCLIDPEGKYMVMELFQGILNMVKIVKPRKSNKDYLDPPEQVRITELKVRASTFLYTETNRPKLALLFDTGRHEPDMRIATYRVVDEKFQYSSFNPNKDRENDTRDLDDGASHLIPVPKGSSEGQRRYNVRNATAAKAHLGGLIVVGETKMTYLDDESKVAVDCPLKRASVWVAWERYDDLNYLLADNYGLLHLLTINVDGAVVTGMDVNEIGKITKATVLVYMGHGILFIGSHEGDSQVVRLNLDPQMAGLEVVQIMENIAPILDFTVMDMGNREGQAQTNEYSSGQARLVTGSGGWEEGSIRSVRSGVGLDDIAILDDVDDVTGLFALRSGDCSRGHDILVVSHPIQTRILRFSVNGDIEEVDFYRGFVLDVQTLLAMNLSNNLILMVTTTTAIISNTRGVIARWTPPAGQVLTAASANEDYLLLAANGVTLVTLDIKRKLVEAQVGEQLTGGNQVASIHVPSHIPNIGIVGFWNSGTVSIVNLSTQAILHSVDLRKTGTASVPRNIALAQLLPEAVSGPTLLVAMEDGIVHTFNVDRETYALSGKKSIVLGTQQAQFQVLPGKDGLFTIFTTCEHPSLIYGSEGRIVYSAVTADSATHVCSFDTKTYPNCIVVATSEHLKISQIDTERRTHVRTMPMGETVRRIAYSASERAFGMGSIKRELFQGQEIISSTFRLVEEVMFGELGKPFRIGNTELIECVIRAKLHIAHGNDTTAERFIVGTSFLDESEEKNVRGRLRVFGVDSKRSPYEIMNHPLKGACRCLAMLDNKIVAALVKTVVVFDYNEETSNSASVTKVATFRTSTCPITLDITGHIIAVGDLMKSVSLVEYTPGKRGAPATLNEVARHQLALWTTAVSNIDEASYLASDHLGNIIVLQRNPSALLNGDLREKLEVTSSLNLGEQVNKIAPIHVEPTAKAIVIPRAFIATTEGSISLFSTIQPEVQDLLIRLQERMAPLVQTLGNLDFNTYRGFKTVDVENAEPWRFVDGELVERFLDVGETMQHEICKGLGPSVEHMRNLVEELKRLH